MELVKSNRIIRMIYRFIQITIKQKKLHNLNEKDKKVVVFSSPTYGNLGDHAIAFAQEKFIHKLLPDYKYYEIKDKEIYYYIADLKRKIRETDIIILMGGGNFGTLYGTAEEQRRYLVKHVGNKNILMFPQSCFYALGSNDKDLMKTKEIFSKNPKLFLTARENVSKEFLEKNFLNHILYTPDIVLSLNLEEFIDFDGKKSGILCSLRNDKEKVLETNFQNQLFDELESRYSVPIYQYDTHIGDKVEIFGKIREEELRKIWKKYVSAELIITDRLHGMIFAYITKTPAIVFTNNNAKIRASYSDWLLDANYIQFIDNSESIQQIIEKIEYVKKTTINYQQFTDEYEPLRDTIKRMVRREEGF